MARCCRRGPVRGSVQLPASGVSPCSRTRYRFFWWIKSIVSYIPRFFPYYHKTFSMLKKHTSILKKNTTIKLFSGTNYPLLSLQTTIIATASTNISIRWPCGVESRTKRRRAKMAKRNEHEHFCVACSAWVDVGALSQSRLSFEPYC